MATPQQEALARQNGFPSYEQMVLWYKQRSAPHTGTIQGQSAPAPAEQAQPQQSQQSQQNAMGWGVAPLFDYIRRAMGGK